MKIYTKTGDDGTTSLFSGTRVKKYSPRVELYGTVDELNTIIGLAISCGAPDGLKETLEKLSNLLFLLGSDLATPLEPAPKFAVPRLKGTEAKWLEQLIDKYDEELPPLKNFILPGGTMCASFLQQARTVCRRAERLAVELAETENIGEHAIIFLNRFSDFLFTAARMANHLMGLPDKERNPQLFNL